MILGILEFLPRFRTYPKGDYAHVAFDQSETDDRCNKTLLPGQRQVHPRRTVIRGRRII